MLIYLATGLCCIVTVYPMYYVLIRSVSAPEHALAGDMLLFPKGFDLKSYRVILSDTTLWRAYGNTLLYVVVTPLLMLLFCTLCAYPLCMPGLLGKKAVVTYLLVPMYFSGGLIPTFLVMNRLGLYNNIWGVILPVVTTTTGIFLYRQHYMSIPLSFVEAARIDGANELQIFTRIMFPLGSSVTVTLTIFSFMWRWNDYILPLLVLSDQKKYTIQIAIKNFIGNLGVDWSSILAASVLSILPVIVIFIFLQKYIIGGISASGVKG